MSHRCWQLLPLSCALVLVAAISPVVADDDPARWSVDDLVRTEEATGWALSADGTMAVWVRTGVATVAGKETRTSNLWLTRLPEGRSVQLTRGAATVSAPAFAPDGRHVAFLSSRPVPAAGTEDEDADDLGKTQLWAIPTAGGEAFPLTRFDRDVQGFGWLDPGALLVAAPETPDAFERGRKQAKDDTEAVEDVDHEPPVRLFRVPADGGPARRVTANRDWVDLVAVAPDGRHALVRAQRSLSYEFDGRLPPRILLVDTSTWSERQLFADGVLRPEQVRWAPDSRSFLFTNQYSRHPQYRTATVTQLWSYDLASDRAEQVEVGWERGLGGDFVPVTGGVLALLADGVRYRPARLERTPAGWTRRDLEGAQVANLAALAATRDGDLVLCERSSATSPPQWFAARLEDRRLGDERRLTDLNPGFADKPRGRVEVVRWRGARDEEVEGLLHYPFGWREGIHAPLVLLIHGGPTDADMDLWRQGWYSQHVLWQQRGAFVLQVNYHGSSGYGLDWVESIGGGAYYELEVPDLELGVDELIRRGLVDPERLAVSGWSNGGILAAELITRTARYRVALVGAADVEWFSDWANVDFGATFDNYYFGGTPWEQPAVYLAKSPFFRLDRVTTPTLIATGTDDTNVPPHQSRSLFRALQQLGRAPVRLLLFPDEPHGPKVIAHQRRKLEEELAWFDRYLFGLEPGDRATIKAGSHLAGLLARARAARSGGALGRDEGGVLAPETVRFAGLEVARFEVTRTQWHAFDPSLPVTAATAELPVTSIPFERARDYAAWLAARTGRPFRLPTETEARRLAEAAGDDGNTLDSWAGYTPNPDDRARLLAALAPVGVEAMLLPVGSLGGDGDDVLFDLDGNAAEWAVTAGGTGKAMGASADQPRDLSAEPRPDVAVTGLRVVVGG
jgi:dipeptidyl aminopeptidase/acylaminoacyl peptidase